MYRKSPKITASLINEQISDCLIENPNVSYEDVIAYLASEYGMSMISKRDLNGAGEFTKKLGENSRRD